MKAQRAVLWSTALFLLQALTEIRKLCHRYSLHFVDRRCALSFPWIFQHVFQSLNRAQWEKGISAHRADFCKHIVKDNDLPFLFYHMDDTFFLVLSGTRSN
jgi:hypothetical protein